MPGELTLNEKSLLATELYRPLREAELTSARGRLSELAEDTSEAEGFNRRARQLVHHMRRLQPGDDLQQATLRVSMQRAMDAAVVVRYEQLKREGRI